MDCIPGVKECPCLTFTYMQQKAAIIIICIIPFSSQLLHILLAAQVMPTDNVAMTLLIAVFAASQHTQNSCNHLQQCNEVKHTAASSDDAYLV